MLAATAAVFPLDSMRPLLLAIAASFAFFLVRHSQLLSEVKPLGGYANHLTLLRLLLLCFAAYGIGALGPTWIFLLFASNVALDVLDGYVARKLDQTTQFSATFDREVDAIYVLVACLYFNLAAGVGIWILVQGLLPYVYRLVSWTMRKTAMASKKQPHAALLAGINFGLLLIAVAVPQNTQLGILLVSTGIVIVSFGISFRELLRRSNENSVLQ